MSQTLNKVKYLNEKSFLQKTKTFKHQINKKITQINVNEPQDNVSTKLLFETSSNNNIILGNTRTN